VPHMSAHASFAHESAQVHRARTQGHLQAISLQNMLLRCVCLRPIPPAAAESLEQRDGIGKPCGFGCTRASEVCR